VVKGLHKAKEMGITTIGFSGNGGGVMAELCDINVIVPSKITMHIVERCYFPDFEATFSAN
jgi:D-sedoheptulose 7-phosphate isomerase